MKNTTKILMLIVCLIPTVIFSADVKEEVQRRAEINFRRVQKQKPDLGLQDITDKDFVDLTAHYWCAVRKRKFMNEYMLLVLNNQKESLSAAQIVVPRFVDLKLESLQFDWGKDENGKYKNGEWISDSIFIRRSKRIDVFVKGGSLEFQIIKTQQGWGLVAAADEPVIWMKKTNPGKNPNKTN